MKIQWFGYTWLWWFDRILGFGNTYGSGPLTPNRLIDISICRQFSQHTTDIEVCQAPQKSGEDKQTLISNPIYTNHSIEAYAGYKGLKV